MSHFCCVSAFQATLQKELLKVSFQGQDDLHLNVDKENILACTFIYFSDVTVHRFVISWLFMGQHF